MSQYLIYKLRISQIRAAKTFLGPCLRMRNVDILKLAGWPSLDQIIAKSTLSVAHTAGQTMKPHSIFSILPEDILTSDSPQPLLMAHKPRCVSTVLPKTTFRYRAVENMSKIPTNIRQISDKKKFKNAVKSLI